MEQSPPRIHRWLILFAVAALAMLAYLYWGPGLPFVGKTNISRRASEGYKVWLCGGAVALAFLWRWLPQKPRLIALLTLTLVAGLNYGRWGPRVFFQHVDTYDVMHYYLNTKYFSELGYLDLYPAAILADHENGGPYFKEGRRYMAQDEEGHKFRPISHAIARGEEVRTWNFTEERWTQFEHDFLFLQRELPGMSDKLWRQMIRDHGYNGTPVWTIFAIPLASMTPVESVKLLGYLDALVMLIALIFVGWAFSLSTSLWVLLFMFITYSARWPTLTWVFLRYDFLAAMLISMAMLKKQKTHWAGFFAGYAATLRFFPAMWIFGPAFAGLLALLRRRLPVQTLRFGVATLITVVALQTAAAGILGWHSIESHFENMMDHNTPEQLSSRRIGFALALPFRGELLPKFIEPERKEAIARQKPVRQAVAAVFLLILGFALSRKRNHESFAFGMIPFFLLTTASYYYYVARITLILMHAADLTKFRNQVGLALLLGLELFSNWAETTYPGHRVFLIGYLSWGMTAYTLIMISWLLWERRGEEPAEDEIPLPRLGPFGVRQSGGLDVGTSGHTESATQPNE